MANNDKENKIKKFTKEAIGKTLNQFNKEIGIADLVEINKNQDRILNGILSQVNDENTEKTEKSNIITLDNSTDGIVELKEIQGDTNVNVSKIVEETPITHVIEDKEGNVISLDDITEGAINIDNIQGNTMVNCNKEPDKELILMEDLSTQGYSNITLNKGVDGGLVDVALEGNTMVNVCDQKDPVAITKSYTVETGNHVALQGEYDGKCRPVVTGNTLVNLLNYQGLIGNMKECIVSKEGSKYIFTKNNPDMGVNQSCIFKVPIKDNTTYTIIINIVRNDFISISSSDIELVRQVNMGSGSQINIPTNSKGIIIKKFTTNLSSTADSNDEYWIGVQMSNSSFNGYTGTIEIQDCILLEGDYTNKPIPEYFEGLQSSFEDKLITQEMVDAGEELAENLGKYKVDYVVTGKNKFDGKLELGSISSTGILINDNSYVRTNNFIKINCNNIIVTRYDNKTSWYCAFYDKDFNFISRNNTGIYSSWQLVIPNNAVYFKLVLLESGDINSNIQIEENTTSTPYEPYKEYKKTFYLNSPLLEGDTIEQQGDNVVHVHRYGKVVLDGSDDDESITVISGTNNNIISIQLDNQARFNGWGSDEQLIICDKLSKKDRADINWDDGQINTINISGQGKDIWISVNSSVSTIELAKQYLQSNPTTAVYKLATPQYEVISQNDTILCDSYVNGHLDVDSVVPIEKAEFSIAKLSPLKYLYPSTEYTIQFESDNIGKLNQLKIGGFSLTEQDVVKGINKFNITTRDISHTSFVMTGIGFNASNIVVTEATDQDFGYFEGMKSVGECEDLEIVSSNKNLFDDKLLEGGEFVTFDGKKCYKFIDNRVNFTYKYNFKPNTRYTITAKAYRDIGMTDKAVNLRITYTDGSYSIIKEVNSATKIFTSDINKTILSINGNRNWDKTAYLDLEIFQIEEGSTATDYIPHQSNTQTLTHEPLRAVGDIKDKYVLIEGKWYIERNCAEIVLDGSEDEDWKLNNNQFIAKTLDNIKYMYNPPTICDKVNAVPYQTLDDATGYGINATYYIRLNLPNIDANNGGTVEQIKTYLQQNPTTVVYPLSTPTYEPINYSPLEVYSDITHISNNSTIPCNMTVKNTGYNCLLKPSTTYTVSSNLGLNTVTTPSVLSEDCLRFYDTNTSTVTTMKNVTVLEGDYTTGKPLPSHFSGIESAFEQEYDEEKGKYKVRAKVVGKNLFDVQLANFNNYTLPGGAYKSCKIRLVQGNNYTLSVTGSGSTGEYYLLSTHANPNEKGAYWYPIISNGVLPINQTMTAQQQDYYVCYWNANGVTQSNFNSLMSKIKVQIEQGTKATPYEPYRENYIEFYINEPLRGVEGVKDRVFIQDDKVIVERKCGGYTFDGSNDENWEFSSLIGKNLIQLSCPIPNGSIDDDYNVYSNTILGYYGEFRDSIWINKSRLYVRIDKNKLQTQDLQGFKQWLQQNPTTVVYQLVEPTYEEIEYSSNRLILDTFNNESFNNSTLFLDTNISPKLSFKPLYEELVYVKNSTKYYIQFNAVGSGEVVINLGGTELTTEIVEGYNCIPITTPSESTNLMTIIGQGITISEVVVSEVICGGYYKGLQSCFEEHMENGKYRVLLRGIALDGSKVNGIKLYLDEPLRGIGDVKDRLCIKDGKLMVERKCASVTFDGSDDEDVQNLSRDDEFTSFILSSSKVATPVGEHTRVICDILPSDRTQHYYTCKTPNIYGWFDDSADFVGVLKGNDVNVRQWLQQNPTTVVYKLAEPTYEEATNEYGLPIVFEGYENGIVYIDSAVTPTTHIKYTSNNVLATTLSETKGQNNSTQDDINVNVVTYMMDIDMLLTEMEMSNDISVMAVRRDNSNENMLDRMSEEDKKVYQDNTVVMLEKMITAQALEKEDIERRINMYYDKNRISKEQYKYLKSLL